MVSVEDGKEVQALEDMFKDRFTERDTVYMNIKSNKLPPPPVVYPWREKQRRPYDGGRFNRRGNYHDRSGSGESSRHHNSSRDRDSYRHRDRSNQDSNRHRDRSNDRESSRNRSSYDDRHSSNRRDAR